jgi:hypothetical protein
LHPPRANDCHPAFDPKWFLRSLGAILLLGAMMVAVRESSAQAHTTWIAGAKAVTTNSATIAWNSAVPADSQVEYGPTAPYASVSTLAPTPVSVHAITLSSLNAGTTYHRRLRARDSGGVVVIGNDHTFTTVAPITVSVSPQSATVVARATQQFSAMVANSTNKAVSWSATAGTVNSSGLFTASVVTVPTAAAVTTTSAGEPAKSAKASVTLQPPAAIVVSISPRVGPAAVRCKREQTHRARRPHGLPLPDRSPQPACIPLPLSPPPPRPRFTATSQADTTKRAFATLQITASLARHSVALS